MVLPALTPIAPFIDVRLLEVRLTSLVACTPRAPVVLIDAALTFSFKEEFPELLANEEESLDAVRLILLPALNAALPVFTIEPVSLISCVALICVWPPTLIVLPTLVVCATLTMAALGPLVWPALL